MEGIPPDLGDSLRRVGEEVNKSVEQLRHALPVRAPDLGGLFTRPTGYRMPDIDPESTIGARLERIARLLDRDRERGRVVGEGAQTGGRSRQKIHKADYPRLIAAVEALARKRPDRLRDPWTDIYIAVGADWKDAQGRATPVHRTTVTTHLARAGWTPTD